MAGQDFRHAVQVEAESVADYIRRLERTFKVAYGADSMSLETREAIWYGQLQEGLKLSLIRSPSVSGAVAYKELCMSSENEEPRQAELKKRHEYHKMGSGQPNTTKPSTRTNKPTSKEQMIGGKERGKRPDCVITVGSQVI